MASRAVARARKDRSLAERNRAERHFAPSVPRASLAWGAFKTAYYAELEGAPAQPAVHELLDRLNHGPVTLLFAARDESHNNAVALKEWLDQQIR